MILLHGCQKPEKNDLNKKTRIKVEKVERYGMIIKLKPEKVEPYKELHANVWPGVLEQISESNIQNYTIFLQQIEEEYYLFSYFEYVGNNFDKDMEEMAADPTTQEWWEITDAYQIPLDSHKKDEWWTRMEEVFHHE